MTALADLRAALAEGIARDQAALAVCARLEAFFSSLEDAGFGVSTQVDLIETGRLSVALSLDCPAGVIEGMLAPEIIEPIADVTHRRLPRDAAPPPPRETPQQAAAPAPVALESRSSFAPGARWSVAEDAALVEMVAGGVSIAQAAKRLGRPVPGTGYRCRKVLRDRIADARVRLVAAPAPEAAPAPAHTAVSVRVGDPLPRRPIAGWDGDDVRACHMRAHLDVVYGAALDRAAIAQDLAMVEALVRGDAAGDVAHVLGMTKPDLLARWADLRGGVRLTLRFQAVLLEGLRALLSEAAPEIEAPA